MKSSLYLVIEHTLQSQPESEMEVSSPEQLKSKVNPFKSITQDVETITKYFDSFGYCKSLLIGDAAHGTSELYSVPAEITKYMMQDHGFDIVAIETDWPGFESVDRYVRYRPVSGQAPVETTQMTKKTGREPVFLTFPTWMWRNIEVRDFVEWMRSYNSDLKEDEAAGFYGLDLYSMGTSMGTSMKAVVDYLNTVDKYMAQVAKGRYIRFLHWADDPHEYGLGSLATSFQGYEEDAVEMRKDILSNRIEYSAALDDGTEFQRGEPRVVKGKQASP
ncbi:L-isoaspartate O-methyltransferase [Fusarium sp. NRRL 52700]|nr:L-isoaspartate O-methyltransferase [Fusarium sp. NRRL 52700]